MTRRGGDPRDAEIGQRVRALRLQRGLSQTELGQLISVTFQQVQKYEKGANRISASRLHQMAGILQVAVPFFFEGAPQTAGQSRRGGDAPSPAYVSEFIATADGLKLVKAFTQISDTKVIHSIVRLVEQLAGEDDR